MKKVFIFAVSLMAAWALLSVRAAEIPDAILLRAAQIPGANLSAIEPVAPDSVPVVGTFWSLQFTYWPPAPCDWLSGWADGQVYWLGTDLLFLIDDSAVSYDDSLSGLQTAGGYGMNGASGDDSTNLCLELVSASLTSATNVWATLQIHAPQPESVYDLFFRTNLPVDNGWWWIARGLPGQTNFFITNLPPVAGFFIAGTTNGTDANGLTAAYRLLVGDANTLTNDFDNDGMSDAWEILNFGNLVQTPGGDYDNDGTTNLYDFQHSLEPNVIRFSLEFPQRSVNVNSATGIVHIARGVPASMAVLVNSTNFASASWNPYDPNLQIPLGTNDGDYEVWIGLRGRLETSQQTWIGTTVTRDTVPPLIVITNPAARTVSQPMIQLQGYVSESLSRLVYDVSNSAGIFADQTGFITGAHPDTNTWKMTTNYFQCYDLPLAAGTNQVSLRATDLAGNVSTTNVVFVLDYSSDTNPPSIAINWPADGALVSGTNFTMNGSVDEDTASLMVSGAGVTLPGLLERGGRFSVSGLPLPNATNVFTVTAIDAAGNSSSRSLTVRQSAVTVTINPVSQDQLSGGFISLSGTISGGGNQVWVNGHPATISTNGWSINLPPPLGGSGNVIVQAGPDQSAIAGEQSMYLTMPARIQPVAYLRNLSSDHVIHDSGGELDDNFSTAQQHWQAGVAGGSVTFQSQTQSFPPDPPVAYEFFSTAVSWPDYWPDGQTFTGVEAYNSGSQSYSETASLPWQDGERLEFAISAPPPDSDTMATRLKAQTKVALVSAGPAVPGVENLVRVTVSALGYSESADLGGPGDIAIAATNISISGQSLAATATNAYVGEYFVVAPAGALQDIPVSVSGQYSDFWSFGEFKTETYRLSMQVNTNVTLEPTEVVSNANFIVGQLLTFSTNWDKFPPGVLSITNQWQFEGNFLNDFEHPCADCSTNYLTNYTRLTNQTTTAWWVSGGTNQAAVCSARLSQGLSFSNGQQAVLLTEGLFSMLRPLPAFYPAIRELVRVDAGNYYTNGVLADGTWLHFGVNMNSSNVGIAFVYTNAPLQAGPGTGTYGRYYITQVIEFYRQQYNDRRSLTNCTGAQAQDGNALDKQNPYDTPSEDASGEWRDSPGGLLTWASWLSVTNSFRSYLMFQPKPYETSLGVPMCKFNWNWSGTAKTNGAVWLKVSGSPFSTEAAPTSEFPTWTHNIINFDTTSNSQTNLPCFDEN